VLIGERNKSTRQADVTLEPLVFRSAPLIGGAVFYFCLSASTGILQTVSSWVRQPADHQHDSPSYVRLIVRARILHHSTDGHTSELCLLEMHLGFRYSVLCLGKSGRFSAELIAMMGRWTEN